MPSLCTFVFLGVWEWCDVQMEKLAATREHAAAAGAEGWRRRPFLVKGGNNRSAGNKETGRGGGSTTEKVFFYCYSRNSLLTFSHRACWKVDFQVRVCASVQNTPGELQR